MWMKDNQVSIQTTINLHDIYQHVLTLSEELVTLARNSEWDNLIARETDYVCAVEHLTQLSHELEKEQPVTGELVEILQAIIENERVTKICLQDHLNFLSKEIKQLDQQRVINKSYGQFSDPDYSINIKPAE